MVLGVVVTNLSDILQTMVCVHTTLSYSKGICIYHTVNMLLPCCVISLVLDLSRSFFISHDLVTVSVICDIMVTLKPKFQSKK